MSISVTTGALDKIQEFMQAQQPPPVGVRLFVYQTPTGVQHGLSFAASIMPSDQIFEIAGVVFVTDSQAALFLNNMTVDYVATPAGEGFVFQPGCSGKNCFQCRGACRGQAAV